MSDPRKMVFLGALDVDRDSPVVLNIPPDADPATISAAIERANIERAEAAERESQRLRALFCLPDETKAEEPPKAKPIARDWLVP